MQIVMLGMGYVGLVSSACFSEFGISVVCIDNQPDKIEALRNGRIPIYEPGLAQLVSHNAAAALTSVRSA